MKLSTTLRRIGWKAMDHWRAIVTQSRYAFGIAAWRSVLASFASARLWARGVPVAAGMIWSG